MATGLSGKPFSENELREVLSVGAQVDKALVTVKASRRYEDAFFNEANVAEREWVRAACLGVSGLAAEPLPAKQFEDLINSIIPNNPMRQTHAFPAVSFREFVHHKLPRKPVFKNDDDTRTPKLFLVGKPVIANRVRPPKEKQSALPT